MHRFYCPDLDGGQLNETESHHAFSVLRIRKGDICSIFDGKGQEIQAEVTQINRHMLRFQKKSSQTSPTLPFRIHLAQALCKNKAWDLILEKSTELGVHQIHPILSDRSVTRIKPTDSSKPTKWRQELIAACKQSGRNWLPQLAPIETVESFIKSKHHIEGLNLIASLQPDAQSLADVLDEELPELAMPKSVTVLVGPEGDFSPSEIGLFRGAGYRPVSLGPNVLRAETASLFICSVLYHELMKNS
ncbi:MAG: RsmE family RNA methyltransferase [Verrucomicrobiota bacterium]